MTDLWHGTSGPHDADIVLIGEAWGHEESLVQKPFVGEAGRVLDSILAEAKIDRTSLLITNVAGIRPQGNQIWRLFHDKDEAKNEKQDCVRGLHPTGFLVSELRRLHTQLASHPRKLVIACGNYALWATSDVTGYDTPQDAGGRRVPSGISNWRGSMHFLSDGMALSPTQRGTKLLPILHPASIMRQWTQRATTVHDLKTRVPQALADDWRRDPPPIFLAPPTFDEASSHLERWLKAADEKPLVLVADVETFKRKLITCIGLADSPSFAMSLPFVRPNGKELENFWPLSQEKELFRLLFRLLRHPNIRWVGQNFAYDIFCVEDLTAIRLPTFFDTMLAHHLLFPGTPKTLEYLSSLYCKYYWFWKEDGRDWDLKVDLKSHLTYNCQDCVNTFEVYEELSRLIILLKMEGQWEKRKAHLALAHRMMNRGVRIDREERRRQGIELLAKRDEIYSWLEKMVPQKWIEEAWEVVKDRQLKSKVPWYSSPEQQKILFRDILGCKLPNAHKTGRPTLGKEALKSLPEKYPMFIPIFDRLEASRSLDVFHSHFIQARLEHDGRIRCSFNPAGTETFRWNSSKNPYDRGTNLQNVPEGTKDE